MPQYRMSNGSIVYQTDTLVTDIINDISTPYLAYENSSQVDVSGRRWVNFFIYLSGNTGGSPDATAIDGYIESSTDGVTWHRVTVEEVSPGTGDATQYDYHWTRNFIGTSVDTIVSCPAIGMYMRLVIKANGTPAGKLTVDAVLRTMS